MADNWDTRTADNCKLPDLMPEACDNCRDILYCKSKHGVQTTIWDFLEPEEEEEDCLDKCDRCVYNDKGCCSYDEPLGRHCVLGDAFVEDLEKMNFYDLLSEMRKRTGLDFEEDYLEAGYQMNVFTKKWMFTVNFDRYDLEGPKDKKKFISVDWQSRKDSHGGGAPCDTIDEAVRYIMSKEKGDLNNE